jgi:hypothetical protein
LIGDDLFTNSVVNFTFYVFKQAFECRVVHIYQAVEDCGLEQLYVVENPLHEIIPLLSYSVHQLLL